MNAAQKAELKAEIMQAWSDALETISINKPALAEAITATDDWIADNAASYNQALPAAVQSGLNAAQKTMLFAYVAMKRYGVL